MTTNSSIKWGLIAFANDGGLGAQTRRLVEVVKPTKILVIDSTQFSPNKQRHLEWYEGRDVMVTHGFPRNSEVLEFIEGLTHVFTVENPYNFYLVKAAQERGIKVVCQTNYEFCENLAAPWLPVPDLFTMPSYWKLSEMRDRFGAHRVMYLPPPINIMEFNDAQLENKSRDIWSAPIGQASTRFLHIVGTLATEDRNGTLDLLKALSFSVADFELVIRSQHELPAEYRTDDPRVTLKVGNVEKQAEMYLDFDAMILPRRYGGLSLTTNEALMSALPVLMPNISPNNELLPPEWLIPATLKTTVQARIPVDVFEVDPKVLAAKLDEWAADHPSKDKAYGLGISKFSTDALSNRYEQLSSIV